jgi:hypothetical protein
MGKGKSSGPDKVTRDSASILGLGIGEVHKTTIHKGGATYTGKGTTCDAADKEAGDKYRHGYKDRV